MTNRWSRLGLIGVCTLLVAATAGAQETTEGEMTTPKASHLGKWQLFITAPPIATQNIAAGFYQPRGVGVNLGTSGGVGFAQFGFGINGGAGYLYNDLIEFVGAIGVDIGTTSVGFGSGTAYQMLLEPGVKLNLEHKLSIGHHLNPFVMAGIPLGVSGVSGFAGLSGGLDLSAGVEFLFGGNWGLTAYVPIGFYISTAAPGTAFINTGLQYGVTGYF